MFSLFSKLFTKTENKYNHNEKTELINEELPRGISNARFVIDRVLTENIKVGILNKGSIILDEYFIPVKYTNQGLQYKNEYYNLIQYKLEPTKLIYDFKGLNSMDRITLELTLISPDIQISLHNYNTIFEKGFINNNIRKTYKTIKMESNDIDKIYELFNSF
jgi:hypothetical protein